MVPHPIPYQGSKRWIACTIIGCFPPNTGKVIEPFAGSAAVTLAAARVHKGKRFVLNDINAPLMALWDSIVNHADQLADQYAALWHGQQGRERDFYNEVRERFNRTHRGGARRAKQEHFGSKLQS